MISYKVITFEAVSYKNLHYTYEKLILSTLFFWGVISLLSAQKQDFARLNIGTGVNNSGLNIKAEYGRRINSFELSGDLSVFNGLPFKNYDSQYYEDPKEGNQSYVAPGLYSWDNVAVNGDLILSVNFNANINVLHFIQPLKSSRHQLKLGGGIGGYGCYSQEKTPHDIGNEQHSVGVNSEFGFQWLLSAKYEYALTDRVNLGIYYDYVKGFNTNSLVGISLKRYF